MQDLSLIFNSDLAVGPTGDLEVVDDDGLINQRILRRLLTNSGDYLWDLGYGGGLASNIGRPISVGSINATVRAQISQEPGIATTPAPLIAAISGGAGEVFLSITYTSTATGTTIQQCLPVGC